MKKPKIVDNDKGALSNVFNIRVMSSTEGLKHKSTILGGMAVLGGGAAIGLAAAAVLPAAGGVAVLAGIWGLASRSCAKQHTKKKGFGL